MQVAELRSLLKSIAQTVAASGGKKAANDLSRICESLDAFGELSLAQFADFLAKADYYVKTGKLRPPGSARNKAKPVDAARVQQAAQAILELYERSIDDEVKYQTIEDEVRKLESLSKAEIFDVAKQVGISRRLESKAAALDEIRLMIEQRKGSFERTAF